ncbi:MAG: LacI family DNA-binding transcriptional regulator [Capsulimonadaceae bacterium]|nr:LacI family DNA-binding transcriptional regulator [Capsulimonadaceae bacterium]
MIETGNRQQTRRLRSASLKDVAERAGIGIATASAVLNGSRTNTRVSDVTRERVLAAAKELDYHANALARALTGQPTKTLGIVFGFPFALMSLPDPYAFAVLQGVVKGATETGYNITLYTEPWHSEAQSSGVLRDGRTDGVLVIAVATYSDMIGSLTKAGIPLVAVSSCCKGYGVPSVDVDNAAGARLATRHLLDLGHRRIAHIRGDDHLTSGIERREAFAQEMAAAGSPERPEYVLYGSYTGSAGYDRMKQLLALPQAPTAVFAANDVVALGAIEAARDCGLNVPGDLSVVGFDDIPIPALVSSGLTTIRQPLDEIGVMAVRMLAALVRDEDVSPVSRTLEPELIVRHSTAPPRLR